MVAHIAACYIAAAVCTCRAYIAEPVAAHMLLLTNLNNGSSMWRMRQPLGGGGHSALDAARVLMASRGARASGGQ